MVRKKIENPFIFFAFCRPFSPRLWLLLAGVVVVTSVIFYFVEVPPHHQQELQHPDPTDKPSLRGSLFTGTHAVLGTSNFEAKSISGKFISI